MARKQESSDKIEYWAGKQSFKFQNMGKDTTQFVKHGKRHHTVWENSDCKLWTAISPSTTRESMGTYGVLEEEMLAANTSSCTARDTTWPTRDQRCAPLSSSHFLFPLPLIPSLSFFLSCTRWQENGPWWESESESNRSERRKEDIYAGRDKRKGHWESGRNNERDVYELVQKERGHFHRKQGMQNSGHRNGTNKEQKICNVSYQVVAVPILAP